jgi:hypothetical protein
MESEKNSALDILGIKGVSDSVKIATEKTFSGASALLSRICLPAAEEFGELLRDKVKGWRNNNTLIVLYKADDLIKRREAIEGALKAPAQIVYRTIESGSWSNDDTLTSMWAGLLASACTPDGNDESNLVFSDLVSHLSPAQARLFDWIARECPKFHDEAGVVQGNHFHPETNPLLLRAGIGDVNQLESELSRLFGFGLFHSAMGGTVLSACKGVSALGLNLYMRVQGGRGDPKAFFRTVHEKFFPDEPDVRWG